MATYQCSFCGKEYATKSSLGRHLDTKKNDDLHPLNDIEAIRNKVVRRGDENLPEERTRKRRAVLAKYNAKEDVKEKNKLRRRERDVRIKARLEALSWFIAKLKSGRTKATRGEHDYSNFPDSVAYLLAPVDWPDNYPGQQEFNELLNKVRTDQSERLLKSYNDWERRSEEEKLAAWALLVSQAVRASLGRMSLQELHDAVETVEIKTQSLFETYLRAEMMGFLDLRDEKERA